jgi:chaperone LolA
MKLKYNFKLYFIQIRYLGILLLLLLGLSSAGIAESSSDIFTKIQAAFDQITDLHAVIIQTNVDTSSKTTTSYTGEVYFQKPNKLLLEYSKPAAQNIVFDGDYLWIYTPELKQVTKQKPESEAVPIPLLFFAGAGNIDQKEFRNKNFISPIKLETISAVSTYRIRIRPKSKSALFKEELFWVNAATFLPMKAKIIDANGIMVTIVFSMVEKDIGIPAATFTMPIPTGVEFVDLTGPAK